MRSKSMSNEKLKTPDDLLRKELNEHGKTLGKKKPCKTCKKKKKLDLGEDIERDLLWSLEEVIQVWGYINETKKLTDPNIAEFSKKVFKDVTGQELDIQGCFGCKSSRWKRVYQHGVKQLYNHQL